MEMSKIFSPLTENDFLNIALETFLYQVNNVEPYKNFVKYLGVKPENVRSLEEIPFLPIEVFKTHKVLAKGKSTNMYFQSSGTSQMQRSKHWIAEPVLYRRSLETAFRQFIGHPEDIEILALLPNYQENKHSSLIYMVDHLMRLGGRPNYYHRNHCKLYDAIERAKSLGRKVLLFGVSFALLDYIEEGFPTDGNEELMVIETGGMKGRKEEITKDEVILQLKKGLGTPHIYSEYSMTELLSQAYALGDAHYQCPSWMRVLIREIEDPFHYIGNGKTGGINIIDLANRYSCSFIQTSDLGKSSGEYFEVLGRIDNSDMRGCSMLVV